MNPDALSIAYSEQKGKRKMSKITKLPVKKNKKNSNNAKNVTQVFSHIEKMSIDNCHAAIKSGIPFSMVPNFVYKMGLTAQEFTLWTYLRSLHPEDNPKTEAIARALKLSKATIRKCEAVLIEKNMLVKELVSFHENPKSNSLISVVYHFPHCYYWKDSVAQEFFQKNPDKIPDEKYYLMSPSIKAINDYRKSGQNSTESGQNSTDTISEDTENTSANSDIHNQQKEYKKKNKKESKMYVCKKEKNHPASQSKKFTNAIMFERYLFQKKGSNYLDYISLNDEVRKLMDEFGEQGPTEFLDFLKAEITDIASKGFRFHPENWNYMVSKFRNQKHVNSV